MQFSIQRPTLPSAETHPEEKLYRRLDVNTWLRHLNQNGQVEEEYKLRKVPRRPSATPRRLCHFESLRPHFFFFGFPQLSVPFTVCLSQYSPATHSSPPGLTVLRTEMTQRQLHCDQGLFSQ